MPMATFRVQAKATARPTTRAQLRQGPRPRPIAGFFTRREIRRGGDDSRPAYSDFCANHFVVPYFVHVTIVDNVVLWFSYFFTKTMISLKLAISGPAVPGPAIERRVPLGDP